MEIQPRDTSRGHFYVSIAKSFIRIFAGIALIDGGLTTLHYDRLIIAGVSFIIAELLGIVEELV